jgi:phosphatidylethanolamine/phosphatidyl-N-methylethanolamine N-methyltransferase
VKGLQEMKMTNRWNRFIYRLWAPVYDATLAGLFLPGRKQAMAYLDLQPGKRVLVVGVGTGADLMLLPAGVQALGIDFSHEMLMRAQAKLPLPDLEVTLIEGDAQQLLVEESAFDAVIFNLILSVIPDASSCLRENLRALKSGGRTVVFDKFRPEGEKLGAGRRVLNFFSTIFGTDITRRFGEIASGTTCKILANEPAILRGMYRVILLRKM